MKPSLTLSLAIGAVAALAVFAGAAGFAAPARVEPGTPRYDANSRLILPADYREWVFLSSGMDMSYSQGAAVVGAHVFDNVFAPRAAYAAFEKTGLWPDKTVLVLENRAGASKGSINKRGAFQTGEVMGLEAHVKDLARFKGGWGFFGFDGEKPAPQIPYAAACYACHQAHAATDTTFVQFYPTLLPVATKRGTLSAAYVAETASGQGKP
ncbi:MAG: cytochrome P460 family protein [Pseudomonadota bacterium]|nr:cytochrome P460 family protein [Pseudomonadota bacterium]